MVDWSDNVISLLDNKNEKIQKIILLFRFIFHSFLVAILVFLIILVFLVTFYYSDLILNSSGSSFRKPLFSTYIIASQSMLPTIKVNDAIFIKRVDNDNYNVGDIVTFVSSDENYNGLKITHRIVKKQNISKNQSLYTTKGDNNPVSDTALVDTDSIYGKVLFRVPKVGKVKNFFSNPVHYFICLLIPIGLFVFYQIGKIFYIILSTKKS